MVDSALDGGNGSLLGVAHLREEFVNHLIGEVHGALIGELVANGQTQEEDLLPLWRFPFITELGLYIS